MQKLGVVVCLNKDTKLYYIKDPIFDQAKLSEKRENYIFCLNPEEFMSVIPRFSRDYSRLLYIGSKEKFLSHTGNYHMSYLNWPVADGERPTLAIDKVKEYPQEDDEFCGISGYN